LNVPYVSRLLSSLHDQGLVTRTRRAVEEVNWVGLLRERAAQRGSALAEVGAIFIGPAGTGAVLGRLRDPGRRDDAATQVVAVTGLVAASTVAPLTVGGRRRATIPPHDEYAVRRVAGIELAVVDRDPMTITSLDPGDQRTERIQVAGTAALLVAKAYKISDRLTEARPDRLIDKDAGDVFQLMATGDARQVGATLGRLAQHDRVGQTAREGAQLLRSQFGPPRAIGVDMAVRALAGVVPETRIRALAPAFIATCLRP
jgi:hypothetical protein